MTRVTVILLALAFSTHARADWEPLPTWEAECDFDEQVVHASFKSRSGVPVEDDMIVTLRSGSGQTIELPLEPALFEPRGLLGNVENLCGRLAGLSVGNGMALFLVSRNTRPGWDQLDVVLVTVSPLRVVAIQQNVGSIKTFDKVFALRPTRNKAYEGRLVREQIQNSGCDCEAAAIEDWYLLSVSGIRIIGKWARP